MIKVISYNIFKVCVQSMLYNSKTVLFVLITFFITACSDNIDPPIKKFDGKPILQPMTFLSGTNLTVNHQIIQAFNVTTKCTYKIGSKRGKFTTPATILVPLTDTSDRLDFNCSHRYHTQKRFNYKKVGIRLVRDGWATTPSTLLKYEGSLVPGWNRFGKEQYVGGYTHRDVNTVLRIPDGVWSDNQFKSAVEEYGVKTFPSTIAIFMYKDFP